jgi:hypothetical protein
MLLLLPLLPESAFSPPTLGATGIITMPRRKVSISFAIGY